MVCGGCVWPLICYAVVSVLSSCAAISLRKRELVALYKLYVCFHLAVSVLYHFFKVPWFGLQYVIVIYPGHTHFLFGFSSGI